MGRRGPSSYRVMPWKNGLGSTTELLIHPPGATLDGGFLWRISMAEVGASGPFSPFPGVDRTLLLLAGRGMELDHGEHGVRRLEGPFVPVAFSGDWATSGRLLDGPCRDFNVMTARSGARHAVAVFDLDAGPSEVPPGPLRVVFCAKGRAVAAGETLEPLDLLETEAPGPLRLSAAEPGTVVIAVTLTPA